MIIKKFVFYMTFKKRSYYFKDDLTYNASNSQSTSCISFEKLLLSIYLQKPTIFPSNSAFELEYTNSKNKRKTIKVFKDIIKEPKISTEIL